MADYKEALHLIPSHMHEGMLNWIEHGIPPGDFLSAVLRNDLMGAVGRADSINQRCLINYAQYLYSDAPHGCYGSPERCAQWSKQGGLRGSQHAEERPEPEGSIRILGRIKVED